MRKAKALRKAILKLSIGIAKLPTKAMNLRRML